VRLVSEELRGRLPVAAVARCATPALHPRVGAMRERARIHWLQPESRSLRRPLDSAAADRQTLVPVLRKNGGAGRVGDGPRQFVLQSELPCHRSSLHQRGHYRVHAIYSIGPVQGFPNATLHYSPRGRRGALPLGPLPWFGTRHEASTFLG